MSDTPGLVNRRAAATRAEIVDAAIAVFLEHGFEETSMQDVADAAGVSRRTLYRYFPTKDDLVFEPPRTWLEVANATFASRRPGEPTRELFRRALLDVGRHIAATRDTVVRSFAVLMASPSLRARHGRSDAEWVARYVELLAPDVAGEPDGPLLALTAAMTLVAAQNAIMAVWAGEGGTGDLDAMARTVLDQVDSVWPPGSRRPPRTP